MAMKDYTEFAQEPLAFPIGGKLYTVPDRDIPTGLHLTQILAGNDPEFNDKPVDELYKLLLGPVWDEMIADGAPLAAASRAGMAALADFQFGRELAEAAWEAGADPKAMTAYLVKQLPRGQRRSRSTGAASTTKRPASTSGTSSRKK